MIVFRQVDLVFVQKPLRQFEFCGDLQDLLPIDDGTMRLARVPRDDDHTLLPSWFRFVLVSFEKEGCSRVLCGSA